MNENEGLEENKEEERNQDNDFEFNLIQEDNHDNMELDQRNGIIHGIEDSI